jgi:hypothetical protein
VLWPINNCTHPMFRRKISPPSSGTVNKPTRKKNSVYVLFSYLTLRLEYGGNMLLRKVELSPKYRALYSRRPNSPSCNCHENCKFNKFYYIWHLRPPLWSSRQSSWLQIQRPRVRFPALSGFLRSKMPGTGSTQPREDN